MLSFVTFFFLTLSHFEECWRCANIFVYTFEENLQMVNNTVNKLNEYFSATLWTEGTLVIIKFSTQILDNILFKGYLQAFKEKLLNPKQMPFSSWPSLILVLPFRLQCTNFATLSFFVYDQFHVTLANGHGRKDICGCLH